MNGTNSGTVDSGYVKLLAHINRLAPYSAECWSIAFHCGVNDVDLLHDLDDNQCHVVLIALAHHCVCEF